MAYSLRRLGKSGFRRFFLSFQMGESKVASVFQVDHEDVEACIDKMKEGFQKLYERKMGEKKERLQQIAKDLEDRYGDWEEDVQCKKARYLADKKEFERQVQEFAKAYPQISDRLVYERLKHSEARRAV